MEFEAVGTHWRITSNSDLVGVNELINKRIDDFDKSYSRFRKDSLVTKIFQKPGVYTLPDDAKTLMDFYENLYKITGGLVTPLIGHTLELAGYDADYSLKPKQVGSPPAWQKVLAYDFPDISTNEPVLLDFGAAGKGYLVDIVGELLRNNNIEDYCINAGGDILVYGQIQRIGLENPTNTDQAVGVVDIKNGALCGSAGNRRAWAGYHHIINPKTLTSPQDIKATWVRAKTAMLADGLATALYFTSPSKLRKHFQFEYAMIKGEELTASAGFNGEFFS